MWITTICVTRIVGQVQIVQAGSGGVTTTYWSGVGAIGEFGSSTSYYLVDGNGSVRQVVDQNASVVFARYYDPFGQILNQNGTGDTLYGYLGGQFDKVIGFMYIDGRYYDPITGRFLSPSTGGQNPYVPFASLSLAPFILIAVLRRKKKGQIWTGWLVLAVMGAVALGVAACGTDKDNKQPNPPGRITIIPITPHEISTPPSVSTPPSAIPLTPPLECPTLNPPTGSATVELTKGASFWSSTPPILSKHIEFIFTVTNANPADYALVQFIKGYAKEISTEKYMMTTQFGEAREYNYPDWSIDTRDIDPVYGSTNSSRWNYERVGCNSYAARDAPTVYQGTQLATDFRMCIFKIVDVPTNGKSTDAGSLMAKSIQCVDWDAKATYNLDGTVTYP